ncbi:DCN1-like protein 5 [Blastocladiella emersonii ATCC 22665]|nr:DCN1-like protein 5 [Blastocladiella emersonii ATCC 22665]
MPPKRKAKTAPATATEPAADAAGPVTPARTKRAATSRASTRCTAFSASVCTKWFNRYKDADNQDQIGPEGIEKLCGDLDLDPSSFEVLVLAYTLGAKQMGYFSRTEWSIAMARLELDNCTKLKTYLTSTANAMLADPSGTDFRCLYRYAYDFSRAEGQKSVDLASAMAMLSVVFPDAHALGGVRARFVEFLDHQTNAKVITRDQWTNLPEFWARDGAARDPAGYDFEASAWPSLFDDFMKWRADQAKAQS